MTFFFTPPHYILSLRVLKENQFLTIEHKKVSIHYCRALRPFQNVEMSLLFGITIR